MIADNKGFFSEAAYDDMAVCTMCEQEMLLFVKDLLDEIQVSKAEIVKLRILANTPHVWGDDLPASDLPGKGALLYEHPLMRKYEELFGEYFPEY